MAVPTASPVAVVHLVARSGTLVPCVELRRGDLRLLGGLQLLQLLPVDLLQRGERSHPALHPGVALRGLEDGDGHAKLDEPGLHLALREEAAGRGQRRASGLRPGVGAVRLGVALELVRGDEAFALVEELCYPLLVLRYEEIDVGDLSQAKDERQ